MSGVSPGSLFACYGICLGATWEDGGHVASSDSSVAPKHFFIGRAKNGPKLRMRKAGFPPKWASALLARRPVDAKVPLLFTLSAGPPVS